MRKSYSKKNLNIYIAFNRRFQNPVTLFLVRLIVKIVFILDNKYKCIYTKLCMHSLDINFIKFFWNYIKKCLEKCSIFRLQSYQMWSIVIWVEVLINDVYDTSIVFVLEFRLAKTNSLIWRFLLSSIRWSLNMK
jgi:hypothetical protein